MSLGGLRTVVETIRWGVRPSDKTRIALYYSLRVARGLLRRDHDLVGGMHPQYWIGDVTVASPIGKFTCRARTIDFDIVNPRYEATLVDRFRERLRRAEGIPIVCLDVGAHIGKFTILGGLLLREKGRVLAFEPEPESFSALEGNIRMNQLTNVSAFDIACGDADRTGQLSISATANIGAHTLREVPGAKRIPVEIRSLDRFLPEQGVDRVDVIKLDVERTEADVLRGAQRILEASPEVTVFFEEARGPTDSESIGFLRALGFWVDHLGGNAWMAERGPRRG